MKYNETIFLYLAQSVFLYLQSGLCWLSLLVCTSCNSGSRSVQNLDVFDEFLQNFGKETS